MQSYMVTLTDEQVFALEYETERRNRLPMPTAPDTPPPPPLTPQEVLQQRVTQDLGMLGVAAQSVVGPLTQVLAVVEPGARAALIAALEAPSLRTYIRKQASTTAP